MACGVRTTQLESSRLPTCPSESEIPACPDEAFLSVSACAPWGCAISYMMCVCLDDQHVVALDTVSDSKQTGCVASRPISQHNGVSDSRKHNTAVGMQREMGHIPAGRAIALLSGSGSVAHQSMVSLVPAVRIRVSFCAVCSRRHRIRPSLDAGPPPCTRSQALPGARVERQLQLQPQPPQIYAHTHYQDRTPLTR